MAVDADHGLVDVRHAVRAACVITSAHVRRRGVADGVGNVDRGGAGVDGRLDHFAEEVELGAGGVFGRELDVVAVARGPLHAGHGPLDDLVLAHLELELAMDGAGGQEDVDPGSLGVLERLPGPVDVLIVAAGQAADGRPAHRLGDFPDGLEVAGRGDREAGLDHVDAQVDQGLGDFQLLGEVHARAGRLLAVAERGVENGNVSRFRHGVLSCKCDRYLILTHKGRRVQRRKRSNAGPRPAGVAPTAPSWGPSRGGGSNSAGN